MTACTALARHRKWIKSNAMGQCQQCNVNFSDLPDVLPVFPLEGVLLLPQGLLPLNIFEPRYIAMFDDALASNRLIGIIQTRPVDDNSLRTGPAPLQKVGCVGKIVQFSETGDGRYLVTLSGLWRFTVGEELSSAKGYRRVRPVWTEFAGDMNEEDCLGIDRTKLRDLMRVYLGQNDMQLDCKQLEGASDRRLITALSMICPFDSLDKQALLEAKCCKKRAQMFMAMLEIATHQSRDLSLH